MFLKKAHKSRKCFGGGGFPQFGTEDFPVGNHGSQHIEPFSSCCFDLVRAPAFCPGVAVGMDLREAGFINVGQCDFAISSTATKLFYLDLCRLEGGFITFFFKEWRVRFHTKPAAFKAFAKVL